MARSESWVYLDVRRIVRDESPVVRVQAVYDDAVLAKIGDVCESVLRVRVDGVGVRLILTSWVYAGSLVLNELGGWRETAVIVNGNDTNAAAVIVGRE